MALSISRSVSLCFNWYSVTHVPFLPARPVLPDLWTYVSVSAQPDLVAGGLFITTKSTMQSRPRAATSVATNTENFFSRKAFIVFSRKLAGCRRAGLSYQR